MAAAGVPCRCVAFCESCTRRTELVLIIMNKCFFSFNSIFCNPFLSIWGRCVVCYRPLRSMHGRCGRCGQFVVYNDPFYYFSLKCPKYVSFIVWRTQRNFFFTSAVEYSCSFRALLTLPRMRRGPFPGTFCEIWRWINLCSSMLFWQAADHPFSPCNITGSRYDIGN